MRKANSSISAYQILTISNWRYSIQQQVKLILILKFSIFDLNSPFIYPEFNYIWCYYTVEKNPLLTRTAGPCSVIKLYIYFPYGKVRRDFIDQLTIHVNQWNNKSDKQHIALKAFFAFLAVRLQKPGLKSKAKDHKECLKSRLLLWGNGEIDTLLNEGRIIQSRIGKGKKSSPPNRAKIFAKLVMEGQINSAMRFSNDDTSGGVLPQTDDVMLRLREKHPKPQPIKSKVLLRGPVQDIPDSLFLEISREMVRGVALRTKGSGPCGVDANGLSRSLRVNLSSIRRQHFVRL